MTDDLARDLAAEYGITLEEAARRLRKTMHLDRGNPTKHWCVDGKWRDGKTADCPLHEKILPRRRVKGADTK